MRIAIDIDSTLHHYWDQFSAALRDRYGVHMAYEDQVTWSIGKVPEEQLRAAVGHTHTDSVIEAGEPYPGAVEIVNGWHEAGHFIHITSHRPDHAHGATARWLDAIGLRYDELYCSFDKITRCREIGIELLVDDSPVNLRDAVAEGMAGATLIHPWNAELVQTGVVIGARDWPELGLALAPLLHRGA